SHISVISDDSLSFIFLDPTQACFFLSKVPYPSSPFVLVPSSIKYFVRSSSYLRILSIPLARIYLIPAPSPIIPGAFVVPLSYLSGFVSGCSSESERLPVPP